MSGCGFKNNLFNYFKYFILLRTAEILPVFFSCLPGGIAFACGRGREREGPVVCLLVRPDGTGPRSSGRLRFCGKRGPAPFSCSTLLPGPSLRSPAYSMTPDWVILRLALFPVKSL